MSLASLDVIRNCLEGFVPSVMATCDAAGMPNVSLISQVHYVSRDRVALSYQFFNKTRRNVLATRCASVAVVDPLTLAQYRLTLDYLGTETAGPLFEVMKAKLSGIASHSGMQGVFRLLGADLYEVRSIEQMAPPMLAVPPPERNLLTAMRRTCGAMAACCEFGPLLERTLDCLEVEFGIGHAMIAMLDEAAERLYTIASRGYSQSGVGSEIALGEGLIGVAAREKVPIRIGQMTSEGDYSNAVRESARAAGTAWAETTRIPYPGLAAPQSQLALPIICAGRTLGVLFVESPDPMRFWYDDEDALAAVAGHLGALIALLRSAEDTAGVPAPPEPAPAPVPVPEVVPLAGPPLSVRYYRADSSVFFDTHYVIKGVAGTILWKLLREHLQSGRVEFSNRELRLDPDLRLPDHAENLEARLVLLYRRLIERDAPVRIEKTGRGRFRLLVTRPLVLDEIGPGRGEAA
jgi:adenylate cyclase